MSDHPILFTDLAMFFVSPPSAYSPAPLSKFRISKRVNEHEERKKMGRRWDDVAPLCKPSALTTPISGSPFRLHQLPTYVLCPSQFIIRYISSLSFLSREQRPSSLPTKNHFSSLLNIFFCFIYLYISSSLLRCT